MPENGSYDLPSQHEHDQFGFYTNGDGHLLNKLNDDIEGDIKCKNNDSMLSQGGGLVNTSSSNEDMQESLEFMGNDMMEDENEYEGEDIDEEEFEEELEEEDETEDEENDSSSGGLDEPLQNSSRLNDSESKDLSGCVADGSSAALNESPGLGPELQQK